MSATTLLTGVVNGGSAIATTTDGPDIGTEIKAEDVWVGEQALLNNDTTFAQGSPTVTGAWTFNNTNGASGTAAITATGKNYAAVVANGNGNGQGVLAQGAGNGAGVQGLGGSGASAPGGEFTGVGSTASGVLAQGGANGNGATCTGGASGGHGCVGIAQDTGASGVKGTAAVSGGTVGNSLWGNGGPAFLDTNPAASGSVVTGDPGPNKLWAGNIPRAWGFIGTTGTGATFAAGSVGGVLGGFAMSAAYQTVLGTSCIVVTLAHTMADVQFSVNATIQCATGGWVAVNEVTAARTTSSFALQFSNYSGGAVANVDPKTISIGINVQVFANN